VPNDTTIQIGMELELKELKAKLATIPGLTEAQMNKMAKAAGKGSKKAADEAGQGVKGLKSILEGVGYGDKAGKVGKLVEGFEALGVSGAAAGVALGGAAIGLAAVAAGAVGIYEISKFAVEAALDVENLAAKMAKAGETDVIPAYQLDAAKKMNDEIGALNRQWDQFRLVVGGDVAPTLQRVSHFVVELGIAAEHAGSKLGDVGSTIETVTTTAAGWLDKLNKLSPAIAQQVSPVYALAGALSQYSEEADNAARSAELLNTAESGAGDWVAIQEDRIRKAEEAAKKDRARQKQSAESSHEFAAQMRADRDADAQGLEEYNAYQEQLAKDDAERIANQMATEESQFLARQSAMDSLLADAQKAHVVKMRITDAELDRDQTIIASTMALGEAFQGYVQARIANGGKLTEAERKAALIAFRGEQAAAETSIVISTARAAAAAFAAAGGFPLGLPAAALSIAEGAAQAAGVAAQSPPQYPGGGYIDAGIGAPARGVSGDHRAVAVETGESILDRKATRAVGGKRGVQALNEGRGLGGATVVQMRYGHRVFDEIVVDSMGHGGALFHAINGKRRPGHHGR
jgi:hypothetical protein